MTYQAKNNAFSTLAGMLSNVATTLAVQTGHGDRFPAVSAPDYTVVTLEDGSGNREVVKVTARTAAADIMTIVRAQEGTTARAWAAGDSVELRMTAAEIQPVYNHIANPAGAHLASAIENTPAGNLAATNVQAALNELQTDVDTRELSINAAAAKATPVDADVLGLLDSATSFSLKKIALSVLKAFLFANPAFTGVPTGPTATVGTNTIQLATTAFVLANTPPAFPAGTRMSFQQTAAPIGWTKDTSAAINDAILRLVTGGVSSGGATAFSTFNEQSSVGATTLSIAQMPSHNHGITGRANAGLSGNLNEFGDAQAGENYSNNTSVQFTGGNGSHSHSLTRNIKYYDFIIASKD